MKLAISLIFLLAACSTPPKIVHKRAAQTVAKTFMWRIEKNGETSFLFGTLHRGVRIGDLPKHVLKRIDESNIFVTETREFNQQVFDSGTTELPDGLFLNELVTPAVWSEVGMTLKAHPLSSLRKLRPVKAALLYAQEQTRAGRAYKPVGEDTAALYGPTLDEQLYEYAKKRGKVLEGLERAAFIDETCQYVYEAAVLEKLIQLYDPNKAQTSLKDFASAYRRGDSRFIVESRQDLPDRLHSCIYDRRNAAWAPLIERLHEAHAPAFIAVGAGHLVLDRSLIQLLTDRGFKVSRVQ